jgi:outer membrane protein TolC
MDRFIPNTLDRAVSVGITSNPAVSSTEFGVDAAVVAVKVNEGALLPKLSVQGSVLQSCTRRRSRSTACARKRGSASAPRSMC